MIHQYRQPGSLRTWGIWKPEPESKLEGLSSATKNKPATEVLHRGFFMESVNLVVLKAAEMIAPYKSTENKYVVLTALTEIFIEHGFTAKQAIVLSLKAYNS